MGKWHMIVWPLLALVPAGVGLVAVDQPFAAGERAIGRFAAGSFATGVRAAGEFAVGSFALGLLVLGHFAGSGRGRRRPSGRGEA